MNLMGATTMLVAVMVIYVLFVTPITALHNIAFYIGVNAFDERIVYSPDKDYVCSKRRTTEIL